MNTDELTNALRGATDALQPRPEFADEVLRGGRRRRGRRRVGAMALTVVAVATAAVAASTWPDPTPAPPAADGPASSADFRFTENRGPLAGDRAYVDKALTVFRRDLGRKVPAHARPMTALGDPNVYWAGLTEASGPVAVIVQRIGHQGEVSTATGLVGRLDGEDALLAVQVDITPVRSERDGHVVRLGGAPMGFFVLPDDRTVLGVARRGPGQDALWLSETFTMAEDGSGTRHWSRMRDVDGVGLTTLDADTEPAYVRILVGGDRPPTREEQARSSNPGLVRIARPDEHPASAPNGITWGSMWALGRDNGIAPVVGEALLCNAFFASDLSDPVTSTLSPSSWALTYGFPDGRTLVLAEVQEPQWPAYLIAGTLDRDRKLVSGPTRLGETDPAAPIVYRLPDQLGVVVAAKEGSRIEYRTASGEWRQAGTGTAVAPDQAVEVRAMGVTVDVPTG